MAPWGSMVAAASASLATPTVAPTAVADTTLPSSPSPSLAGVAPISLAATTSGPTTVVHHGARAMLSILELRRATLVPRRPRRVSCFCTERSRLTRASRRPTPARRPRAPPRAPPRCHPSRPASCAPAPQRPQHPAPPRASHPQGHPQVAAHCLLRATQGMAQAHSCPRQAPPCPRSRCYPSPAIPSRRPQLPRHSTPPKASPPRVSRAERRRRQAAPSAARSVLARCRRQTP